MLASPQDNGCDEHVLFDAPAEEEWNAKEYERFKHTIYKPKSPYKKTKSYGNFHIFSEDFKSPDYLDSEQEITNNSVRYLMNKSHDGETVYRRGRLITVHEAPLPVGLLGYTDTNSDIFLTTRDDFDVPKRKVKVHEELHCSEPDLSEIEIRYKTDLEFRPLGGTTVIASFYQEPIYTD